MIKFIPPGQEDVPDNAFWTERGQQVHDAEPGRFGRGRLEVVRDTYHRLAGQLP